MWACKFYNTNKTIILPRDGIIVLEYFLSMSTRVRRKVIVLEYITKVIVLMITSHHYIFLYEQLQANILDR